MSEGKRVSFEGFGGGEREDGGILGGEELTVRGYRLCPRYHLRRIFLGLFSRVCSRPTYDDMLASEAEKWELVVIITLGTL